MLQFDQFDTPKGRLTLVKSNKGICFVGLPSANLASVEKWASKYYQGEQLVQNSAALEDAKIELIDYMAGRRQDFSIPLDHRNTSFAQTALQKVAEIGYGKTATYGMIAHQLGKPRSARAVGRAAATNPLPLIIPCHRVVGSDGSLTGYGGGLPLKKALLDMERSQTQAPG